MEPSGLSAAAIAVLDVIESESLVRNAFEVGSYLIENLLKIQREKSGQDCRDTR